MWRFFLFQYEVVIIFIIHKQIFTVLATYIGIPGHTGLGRVAECTLLVLTLMKCQDTYVYFLNDCDYLLLFKKVLLLRNYKIDCILD